MKSPPLEIVVVDGHRRAGRPDGVLRCQTGAAVVPVGSSSLSASVSVVAALRALCVFLTSSLFCFDILSADALLIGAVSGFCVQRVDFSSPGGDTFDVQAT